MPLLNGKGIQHYQEILGVLWCLWRFLKIRCKKEIVAKLVVVESLRRKPRLRFVLKRRSSPELENEPFGMKKLLNIPSLNRPIDSSILIRTKYQLSGIMERRAIYWDKPSFAKENKRFFFLGTYLSICCFHSKVFPIHLMAVVTSEWKERRTWIVRSVSSIFVPDETSKVGMNLEEVNWRDSTKCRRVVDLYIRRTLLGGWNILYSSKQGIIFTLME